MGPFSQQESPLHASPRSAADPWLQVMPEAGSFSCFHQEEKKKFKVQGAKGGSKKCVWCLCVCIHTYLCIYKHACVHRYVHEVTPALSSWDHAWERETCPLVPHFTDHRGGLIAVGLFFFFSFSQNR